LFVGCLPVSDACLKEIGSLRRLRHLNLQGTEITDAGLQYLSRLSELRWLNLSRTTVTVEGIRGLKDLKNVEMCFLYDVESIGESEALIIRREIFPRARVFVGVAHGTGTGNRAWIPSTGYVPGG
jgi:hypothetical protein